VPEKTGGIALRDSEDFGGRGSREETSDLERIKAARDGGER
jgi:hypothetical protein